jgi:LPXTG-motif cell wall-anchored protein
VSTQVSDQAADVGAVLSDTLEVSGLPDDLGEADGDDARLVVTLFGPFDEPPGEDDCTADAPVVGREELVARNGTLTTGGFGPLPAAGWYTFVERLEASDRVAGHTGPCGAVTETTFVPQPPAPPAQPPVAQPPVAQPPVEVQRPAPVRPRPPGSAPELPRTGSESAAPALGGGLLVAVGGLLVVLARPGTGAAGRRRQATPTSGWVPTRPVAQR